MTFTLRLSSHQIKGQSIEMVRLMLNSSLKIVECENSIFLNNAKISNAYWWHYQNLPRIGGIIDNYSILLIRF